MFSVIIPLYNKEKYIRRTMQSVLNQTFDAFEIIIIDDGSTDDGYQIISTISDERIKIFSKKNEGVSAARNLGIEKARYNYIAFLDADDYWHPNYLKNQFDIISRNPDAVIIGSRHQIFKSDDDIFELLAQHREEVEYEILVDYFKNANNDPLFLTSAVIARKESLIAIGNFDVNLTHGEDLDVWFQLMVAYEKGIIIKTPLVFYYKGDTEQATANLPVLSKHLVGNIYIKYNAAYGNGLLYFDTFIIDYILLNLRPYYFSPQYTAEAAKLLSKLKVQSVSLPVEYKLPYTLAKVIYRIMKWIKN